MNQILLLVLAIILAVLMDLYIIRNWRRYRRVRQDNWTKGEKIRAWFGQYEEVEFEPDKSSIFSGVKEEIQSFLTQKTTKVIIFFVSIGLVLSGQYMIGQSEPIEALIPTSQRINDQFRIDVDNLDNVLLGVPLILLGGILFAISARAIIFRGDAFKADLEKNKPALGRNSKWVACIAIGSGSWAFLLLRLFLFEPNLIDTILWIIGMVAFLIAAFWWDRAVRASLRINIVPSEIVQLILIFSFGLIVGVYQLQDVPNLLMGDEGTFFETARAIALGTYTPSPFDLGVYSYPILSSLWQAGILKMFGITLWGWRFASVLPAVLTVIPLYLLSRELFGRSVAALSALGLAVTPYFLAFSRMGYNNSQSILIVTLCIWLVYLGSKKESAFYALLGGLAAGLGFLTYTAGRLGLVVACLYFLILFIARSSKGKRRRYLGSAIFPFVVGWVVIALPSLIYAQQQAPDIARNKMLEGLFFQVDYGLDFYEEDELFQYASPLELDKHKFFYNPQIYKELLVRGGARTLLAFHHKELVSEHFVAGNLAGPLATVFYALGGFLVLGRLRDHRFLLIAIWFFSGLFFLSIINTYPPRHQHLVPVIPVVAIMIGLGVTVFTRQVIAFFAAEQKSKRAFQFALMAVIVAALGVTGLREYFVVMPTVYRPHLEQIMNWFGLYNSPEVNFVLIHAEPVHEEWRPYLFRELLAEHKFTLIGAEEFLEDESGLTSLSNTAVFYNPEHAGRFIRRLQNIYPHAQEYTFYDRDQEPIAGAVIQGDINIPAQTNFFRGLWGVFSSPVIWILIPMVLFLVFYWRAHKQELRASLLSARFQEVQPPCTDTETGIEDESFETSKKAAPLLKKAPGFFEIGFFIQFSSGDETYRFEPKITIKYRNEENGNIQEDETELSQ